MQAVAHSSESAVQHHRLRVGVFIDWIGNAYADATLSGIARAAEAADCDVVYFVGSLGGEDFPRAERHHPLLYASAENLDGILVVSFGGALSSGEVSRAVAHLEPLPMCGLAVRWTEHPSVEVDSEIGVYLGVDHLIRDHGRRRIACIRGPRKSAEAEARFMAYQRALEEHGLPLDPNLVVVGNFVLADGERAVCELLDERRVVFDAIVAGNDSMALGAMRELQRRGIRVPEQVALLGFDDVSEARHAQPPLSTVRQPIVEHTSAAFGQLLAQIEGRRLPQRSVIASELVLRRSCGCTESAQRPTGSPPAASRRQSQEAFCDALARWFYPFAYYLSCGDPTLLNRLVGLCVEGASNPAMDAGASQLANELDRVAAEHHDMLRVLPIIHEVERLALHDLPGSIDGRRVLAFCRNLSELIAQAVDRHEANRRHKKERLFAQLLTSQRSLAQAVSCEQLRIRLADCLRQFGIESCFLCMYEGQRIPARSARVVLAASASRDFECAAEGVRFSTEQLLPPQFMDMQRRSCLIQYPLFLAEEGASGYVLIERGALDGFVHDALAQQVFASYRRVELMEQLIHEARRREAAERERLEREMGLAMRIQTGILPRRLQVPGLEIAAQMLPATEVGGDYYDVIPHSDGCWFGIGDVAGHGLPTGLVMLMLQSVIGGLTRNAPNATPAQILPAVNALMVDNIRHRLLQDEHITLTLLRYERSGRVVHAGAHEEILVYRTKSGEVELIPTLGAWVGIRHDLAQDMTHHQFQLEPGDLMLLHTDGISESKNEQGELFGLERVASVLSLHHHEPVQEICEAILRAVRAWSPDQDDDITLVLARQRSA